MTQVRDAYNFWATNYDTDQNRTRDLDEAVTRQQLSNSRCSSVLELGCGTGKNTTFLAMIGERVLALDFSPAMLEQARRKIASPHVIFAVADLTHSWPCADGSVSLVVCNLVLEHVENLDHIFAEAFRVLVPNGRFFLSELHPERQLQGSRARYTQDHMTVEIDAFVHTQAEFEEAAERQGLRRECADTWRHPDDAPSSPPRLLTFWFTK